MALQLFGKSRGLIILSSAFASFSCFRFQYITVVNHTIALQDVDYYLIKHSSKKSSKTAELQKYFP